MQCPYCLHPETKVVDSRESESSVRRRRECLKCEKRYTTYEQAEIDDLVVIKKDGRREPFDRAKLIKSITLPCQKRPIKTIEIERMADQIELDLKQKDNREVTSRDIGELVMSKLKQLDKIAYIRFAAVYREFEDVQQFRKELKVLLRT
ncbi:transcriptional regulator NrdR [Candidatus Woesearchaeota archaeon]|nr:transcriptional regulator NrdR [Candidatus Woesearchaeota archaeon]